MKFKTYQNEKNSTLAASSGQAVSVKQAVNSQAWRTYNAVTLWNLWVPANGGLEISWEVYIVKRVSKGTAPTVFEEFFSSSKIEVDAIARKSRRKSPGFLDQQSNKRLTPAAAASTISAASCPEFLFMVSFIVCLSIAVRERLLFAFVFCSSPYFLFPFFSW